MAYDQVMEKVESCVYENHLIPPAREDHKSQYILSTGIRFIFQVNIERLCNSFCDGKGFVKSTDKSKKQFQQSTILNKIEIYTSLFKEQKIVK
jgi:hypothetical protein